MTPKELREKARVHLADARSLCDLGRHDNASYLAGYAAEFSLKSRYCTRKGWADFPDDRAEARRRGAGKVMTHDLEELLRLSDHTSLRALSMLHIDWDRVLDWSEEQRYDRAGSVTPERARARIEETQRLCDELALYEIVEKLLAMEVDVSRSSGPFNFFALAEGATRGQGWEVVMSAWWLLGDNQAKVKDFMQRVRAVLDDDLCEVIQWFTSLHPLHGLVQAFHRMAFGGFAEHHPRFVTSDNVVGICTPGGDALAVCVLPPAFIVTNVPRQAPPHLTPGLPLRGDPPAA